MLRAIKVASSTDNSKNSITLTVVLRRTVNDEDTTVRCTTFQLRLLEAMKVRVKLSPMAYGNAGRTPHTPIPAC